MSTKKKHPNIGSDLDSLLAADGTLLEIDTAALKRVVALQLIEGMRKQHLTKQALARRMHTSRTAVDRLLDASNGSVTLETLGKAAAAIGRRLTVALV